MSPAEAKPAEDANATSVDPKVNVAPPSVSKVIVHPIVLLSVVDHYTRVAQNTKRRVVGVILGERKIDGVHVTNAYAVPFEEDPRDSTIWFLDHNFLENMYAMFRKVNAREKILGWYHTGPKLRTADLDINELFRKYTKDPILVVVDPKPEHVGIPTEAYHVHEETKEDGGTKKTFVHIPSAIGAAEAEEIGVEHLLRDIKDMTVSSLGEQLAQKMTSLKGLHQRLNDIYGYLEKVVAGTLPVNNEIIFQLQDIFNLLPHLDVQELVKAFAVKTNDMMLVIYLSSVIRSVIALHNLINNKIALKEAEQSEGKDKDEKDGKKKEEEEAKDGDKDKKDAKTESSK